MSLKDECEDSQRTNDETETKIFGFGRSYLKDSIRSMIEFYVQTQFNEAKSYLENAYKSDEDKERILSKCGDLAMFAIDKSKGIADSICGDVDNYFRVPDDVVLPGDEEYEYDVTEAELDRLGLEVEEARARALRADAMKVVLRCELVRLQEVEASLGAAAAAARVLRATRQQMGPSPGKLFKHLKSLSQH